MSEVCYFYGWRSRQDGTYHGIVTHYDDTCGAIMDYETAAFDQPAEAMDAAGAWAVENHLTPALPTGERKAVAP